MTVIALTNAFTYAAGYDFTTDTNNVLANVEVAALDKTNFRSGGWNELHGGLKAVTFNQSGHWQAAATGDQAPDNQAFSALGTSQLYTFGAVETEGSPAYMFNATKTQYTLGGDVGALAPYSLAASGSGTLGMLRGSLAKARGNVSATGALGTGLNIGSGMGDVHATFHVFSAGTTITVVLESDSTGSFSTPNTVATIGPLTASGATLASASIGSGDTWFRFRVSAITGTFAVAGAIYAA